jgi:hypothetical protein
LIPLERLLSSATYVAVLLLLAMQLSCCEVATLLLGLVYCCCNDAWGMGAAHAYERIDLHVLIRMTAC